MEGPDKVSMKEYFSMGMGIITIFDNLISFGKWFGRNVPAEAEVEAAAAVDGNDDDDDNDDYIDNNVQQPLPLPVQ